MEADPKQAFRPGGTCENYGVVAVYGYGAVEPDCPPFDDTCEHPSTRSSAAVEREWTRDAYVSGFEQALYNRSLTPDAFYDEWEAAGCPEPCRAAALSPQREDTGEGERIAAAIKATEYKYFGDYEMSDDQRQAVDVLVEFARQHANTPAAADRIASMESALRECADDLEAELRDRYRGMTFPAAQPKYDADMETVLKARALLDGGDHAR